MRVALCLSGHVRTLMQTHASLRSAILEPWKPDVFVHTWDTVGLDGPRGETPVSETWLRSTLMPVNLRIKRLDELNLEFARRRDELFAVPGPILPFGDDPDRRLLVPAMLSQLYGVHHCDLLRREHEQKFGFRYDAVIRGRMDNLFRERLPLGSLELSIGRVFIPNHAGCGGYCDQFALGDSDTMTQYANYYLRFQEVWRSRPMLPYRWGPQETMLRRYLDSIACLKVHLFKFDFELQRQEMVIVQSHVTAEWFQREVLGVGA